MMKKTTILALLICCALLAACSNKDNNIDINTNDETASSHETTTQPSISNDNSHVTSAEVMKAKIIEAKENHLLIIDLDSSVNSLYTISPSVPVIENKELLAGAIIEIGYDGLVLESYPAQIANADYINVLQYDDDLVGLYKKVFAELLYDDLLESTDSIHVIAFDLSKTENISDVEKNALLYVMWNLTGTETRLATFDELVAEGLIKEDKINEDTSFHYFKNGILISLELYNIDENNFKFNAKKWRGSLASYDFVDCHAEKIDHTWSYTVGSVRIS